MTERKFIGHPESAPGDFYVVNGDCISCGAPHAVAPDLIGWARNSEYAHCIWKKQPQNREELEQAIAVFEASDVGCHRYAGTDPSIIGRIGADYCDAAPFEIPLRRPRGEPPEFRATLIAPNSRPFRFVIATFLLAGLVALVWLFAR